MKYLFLILVLLIAAISVGNAALPEKNSADFANKYECDVVPDDAGIFSQLWVTGGSVITATDGILTLNVPATDGVGLDAAAWTFNDDIAGDTGYTIEMKFKLETGGDPTGHMNFFVSAPWGRDGLVIGENFMTWYGNNTSLSSADNTNDYHIIRIASDKAANTAQVWRDLEQVGTDLPFAYGAYKTWFGDGSSGMYGISKIDYIRYDKTGAFAPVGVPKTATINANITLEDLATITKKDLATVSVSLLAADKSVISDTRATLDTLPEDGPYVITKELLAGDYFFEVSAPKWLTKIVPFTVVSGVGQDIAINVLNGDINGDGKINVSDYNRMKTNWFKIGDSL